MASPNANRSSRSRRAGSRGTDRWLFRVASAWGVMALGTLGLCTGPSAHASPAPTTAPTVPTCEVLFFTQPGCARCEEVEAWLDLLQQTDPGLRVRRVRVDDLAARRRLQALAKHFRLPQRHHLVTPAIFAGGGALVGEQITFSDLVELLEASAGRPVPEPEAVEAADRVVFERFRRFRWPLVLMAGFLDGLNPCALALMVFFVSYLRVGGRSRADLIVVSASFISAVFLTYSALGLGLLRAVSWLHRLSLVRKLFHLGVGGFAIGVGLAYLRDAVRLWRGEEATMELSAAHRERTHLVIRRAVRRGQWILGAFVSGVLVSVLELVCTGQTYLPTLTFLWELRPAGRTSWAILGWLTVYNAAFIMPLGAVALMTAAVRDPLRATSWVRRSRSILSLALAALLLGIGLFLIANPLQFMGTRP